MKKGLIMLFLLSFCVAATQARNVDTRKTNQLDLGTARNISLNVDIAKNITNTATRAVANEGIWEPSEEVKSLNLAVKQKLADTVRKYELAPFAAKLKTIYDTFNELSTYGLLNGVYEASFPGLMKTLKQSVEEIRQYDPAAANEVLLLLKKAKYVFLKDRFFPLILRSAAMTWDEAIEVQFTPASSHSAG